MRTIDGRCALQKLDSIIHQEMRLFLERMILGQNDKKLETANGRGRIKQS